MINLYQYESPRAQELPQDFIVDLLDNLTADKLALIQEANYINHAPEGEMKENRWKWHERQKLRHQGAIETLAMVGLNAAWNWVSHRDQYIFPTYADCEMQEDWLWQCMED